MEKPMIRFFDPRLPLEATEENGVKAIIFLQKLGGIVETEEMAKQGWNGLSSYEREETMLAYQAMGGMDQ